MTTLYGIKNCDTVKKARKWFETNGIDYTFHDFRADGINKKLIDGWAKSVDWELLLNRRSTTWRQLDEQDRDGLNKTKAVALLIEHPTLIKRPVLDHDGAIQIGFKDSDYASLFGL
ncbi:arsenate reductase [Solemya pervernicosa gill symbiont]|uniref:Arsenate reductase n=2 Tax=Gammaproteobacteria incertae sedis TaxID=118884 RepID=A0A1T2L9A4_9GAMM|nr:ArsC family reductase [Candidatus Reidiella endopervernicosa]OOZ41612.1 arsenate reductase [Solemya pervernicosa gill symbiont]QKQ26893.1 ArsC family reductase [Candidatus Reidiella endopervernicosa]